MSRVRISNLDGKKRGHGLQKPSWKTIQNSRRKWGIDSIKTADGWEWYIPDHE